MRGFTICGGRAAARGAGQQLLVVDGVQQLQIRVWSTTTRCIRVAAVEKWVEAAAMPPE
jgi:hypothetical protein